MEVLYLYSEKQKNADLNARSATILLMLQLRHLKNTKLRLYKYKKTHKKNRGKFKHEVKVRYNSILNHFLSSRSVFNVEEPTFF